MSVIVLSCGRTGTNLVTEMLRGNLSLHCQAEEEKSLWLAPRSLPEGWLAKSDTHYVKDLGAFEAVMDKNPDLKIIWTVRNFKDVIMSKIYRGQPGKDNLTLADDATHEGCKKDIEWMYRVFQTLQSRFPRRFMIVKMEDVLTNPVVSAQHMCRFLNVPYDDKVIDHMVDFPSRMRNPHKKARYTKIDKSQINLWKTVNSVYDGFFKAYAWGDLLDFAVGMNLNFGYKEELEEYIL